MAAAARREEGRRFVGRAFGRAKPVLEFRSSAKPLPISGTASVASPAEVAEVDVEDGSIATDPRDQPARERAESEVRVSRRPTVRLPVVPRLVRHTGLDLGRFAPRAEPSRALRLVTKGAISFAAVVTLLVLATIVARAIPADRVNARASIASAEGAASRSEKSVFEHARALDEGAVDRLASSGISEELPTAEDVRVELAAVHTPGAAIARVSAPKGAHGRTPHTRAPHAAPAAHHAAAPRPAAAARPLPARPAPARPAKH